MDYKYFELAARAAVSKVNRRTFLVGACGIRSDGALITSFNGAVLCNYQDRTSFPPAHAEYRLAKKLDVGSVVYVVRVKKDTGAFRMARPCVDCQRVLLSRGVKKIYYTVDENEYGVIDIEMKSICNDRRKSTFRRLELVGYEPTYLAV